MSIASLFKPVDSSKTRLPRTDVLERVAKYADGKSVVSNYFDISTPELVQMLSNDLVPAQEIEYVTNIVKTRLSGETTAAPKTSVGETISTKPIKEFTVSDPTKDFITLEDIIGTPTAPSGFERGKYLESLIGSGTTGGPTQRGSPAKDKDYLDPLNARPDAPPARLGLEGPTPGRRPSGGMSYTPEAPEDSASIRQAALGSAEDRQNALDFLKKNQAVIDYYSKQRGEDPTRTTTVPTESVDPKDFTARPVDPYVEPRQTGGMSYTPQTPTELIDPRIFTTRPVDPNVDPNIEPPAARNNDRGVGGPTVGSEFDKRGLVGAAQYLFSQPPSGPIDREVPKNRQYTPSDSALKNAITGLVYGSEGVAEAKRAPEEELKRRAAAADKATTDRMNAREAGISALSSDVGAATDKSGGIVPRGVDPTGIGRDSTPTPAFVAGTDPTRVTSAPSATPTAAPDKPTKDEKNDIKKAANEVAKNPSVGGIQSLFEQAGFSDALLQLGLGMMASKNPDFLGSLGEAGQSAVALMAKQREEAKKAKLEADKNELERQRVDIYGRSVDNAATTDKRPAIVQTSEAYSTAIKTAKEQAKNNEFDTTEQFMARDYASKQIVPAAQEAAQKAAIAWDKIYEGLSSSKKKEYDEKNPKDAYVNKAYQASLQQNPTLYKLLNIGVPTEENTVKKFDVATGTLIK